MSEQADNVPVWDLADRMSKALRHSGMGVAEIADYCGVNRTTVSNWINGRTEPRAGMIRLWAIRTNVSYDWLRDGDQPAPALRAVD